MSGKAQKFDGGKTRLDLISPEAMELLGQVLTHGAEKYSAWNWAKGMEWSRAYGAALRHMNAWWSGENRDPESGLSHIGHALCCLMFLAHYEATGTGTDDRWKWAQEPRAPTAVSVVVRCRDCGYRRMVAGYDYLERAEDIAATECPDCDSRNRVVEIPEAA